MPSTQDNAERRTARLRELVHKNPTLTPGLIAETTGRQTKTVAMWLRGRPQAIPEVALRLLEVKFAPSSVEAAS